MKKYFAKIENSMVTEIVPAEDGWLESENKLPGEWIETSMSGEFRKNSACIGGTYDSSRDAFIDVKPFASWTLNEETCQWKPPVARPSDYGETPLKVYKWNEETQSWDAPE